MNYAPLLLYIVITCITPGPNNIMCMYLGAHCGLRGARKFMTASIAMFFIKMLLCGILNVALADVLMHAVDRGERLADVRVLSRFERRRMPHNLALMAAMEGFERLFQADSLTARLLRNTGLKWVDKMPEAKALFVRQALGLSGDLPPLARP